jgi:hypothetical protein
MDAEIAARFATLEREIAALRREREARNPGNVVHLKQAAFEQGVSPETMRRKVLHDPAWQKRAGRWVKSA